MTYNYVKASINHTCAHCQGEIEKGDVCVIEPQHWREPTDPVFFWFHPGCYHEENPPFDPNED